MSSEEFEQACDRLSCIVDPNQFQRLIWARTEAPMLARLVELLDQALEDRPDFAVVEEGSSNSIKRHVLRIHGNRIVAITLRLNEGQAVIDAEAVERSRFQLKQGEPLCDQFDRVDEEWMAAALRILFARIYPIRRESDRETESRPTPAAAQAPAARGAHLAATSANSRRV